jgi:hypothetical protein
MTAEKPHPPKHLRAATARWWSSIAAEYVLESHHVRLLTHAAECWDRAAEAREALAKLGTTYMDRFGQPHARPEIGIERDSKTLFARLLRELALDVIEPDDVRPPTIQGKGKAPGK